MKKVYFLTIVAAITLLATVCFYSSCGDNERVSKKGTLTSETIADSTLNRAVSAKVVNVYIENSGSMDGYVNGQTEFKGAIRDLLVLLKHYYEKKVNLFFINTAIHQTATNIDLAEFSQKINLSWRTGDRSTSNLNKMFSEILKKTNDSTISILLSDCIYSIPQKGNTVGLLNDAKGLTKDAFLSKSREDKTILSTTILKMKSKFKGKYFPFTGDANWFTIDMERPYYICIIGCNNVMKDFNKKISFDKGKIEGFDNKYIISAQAAEKIYYSVLLSTDNVGRFKTDRKVIK